MMATSTTAQAAPPQIPTEAMRDIYEQTKTPFKHGVIITQDNGNAVDCPSVFRFNDEWRMLYVCMNKVGYETHLADSDDLLTWTPRGKVLSFREEGWDKWQCDGGIALVDHEWGGSAKPQPFNDRYWMSYIGGALQGYVTVPLSMGMARTKTPDQPVEWARLETNPVLSPSDPDARDFEKKTLYKSQIIWDKNETLGHPFVMFYNGKQAGKVATERIGMAVSEDMVHWTRFGREPVVDNGPKGISRSE